MNKRTTALALATCMALAGLAMEVPSATAGEYTVKQCNANTGDTAFGFDNRVTGLISVSGGGGCGSTMTASPNATYAHGTWGGYLAYAPAGVDIVGFSANVRSIFNPYGGNTPYSMSFVGDACASSCVYGNEFLRDVTDRWNTPRLAIWHGAGGPARRVFVGFRCIHSPARACVHGGLDMRLTFSDVSFTMNDPTPPVARTMGGSVAWSGWRRGMQELVVSASDDGGGVARIESMIGATKAPTVTASCSRAGGDYSRMAPCPLAHEGAVAVDTTTIADGTRRLAVQAYDAAGTASAPIAMDVRIDNGAPAPPHAVEVVGGAGWRRANGFSVRWENPEETDRAPLVRSHWRACPVGGGACVRGASEDVARVDGITLPSGGEWNLRAWVEDGAGNGSAEDPQRRESAQVLLRYDAERPELTVMPTTRWGNVPALTVAVSERFSGLASGVIEVRRQGESEWRPLPTKLDGPGLVGVIDDATLPAGAYTVRARATDHAGNLGATEAGEPTLQLPLRTQYVIDVGAVVHKTVKRRVRQGGRQRTVRRRTSSVLPTTRVPAGRLVVLRGRLRTRSGERPSGVHTLSVREHPEFGPARFVGRPSVDSQGRFEIAVPATRNAVVRVALEGDDLVLPAAATVKIQVRATTSLRPSRRTVRNGRGVTLAGQVHTLPAPTAGKLVEIQAHFRGRWRTFQTVRTGADGRWRFRYRFGATQGRVRYRFRARLSPEGGYPYTEGVSRPVKVTVTG